MLCNQSCYVGAAAQGILGYHIQRHIKFKYCKLPVALDEYGDNRNMVILAHGKHDSVAVTSAEHSDSALAIKKAVYKAIATSLNTAVIVM